MKGLIEIRGIFEHGMHRCHILCIPLRNFLTEQDGIFKHAVHTTCQLRGLPWTDVLIETRALANMPAMLLHVFRIPH